MSHLQDEEILIQQTKKAPRPHQPSHETASILHELGLGQHTLFLMSDGSIDLLANDEQTPYLADNGVRLDSDETRLAR